MIVLCCCEPRGARESERSAAYSRCTVGLRAEELPSSAHTRTTRRDSLAERTTSSVAALQRSCAIANFDCDYELAHCLCCTLLRIFVALSRCCWMKRVSSVYETLCIVADIVQLPHPAIGQFVRVTFKVVANLRIFCD